MEVIDSATVSVEAASTGDFRGAVKPGGKGKRQVSLIEAGRLGGGDGRSSAPICTGRCAARTCWSRVSICRRRPGAVIAIGEDVRLEITVECDPCSRMEEIAAGLKAALTPDWRGGALARVLRGGDIAVGDEIRIEE